MLLEGLSWACLLAGTGFLLAGTVGLLRFPDTLSRLHALTKADSAGLGLVALGLGLRSANLTQALVPLLVWLLVLLASGPLSALLAGAAMREEE